MSALGTLRAVLAVVVSAIRHPRSVLGMYRVVTRNPQAFRMWHAERTVCVDCIDGMCDYHAASFERLFQKRMDGVPAVLRLARRLS